MTKHSSDFPEFDQAYRNALIKDPTDPFERLAAEANFNVYHSDIWRGTGRKFAELIVRECMSIIKQGEGLGEEDDFDKGFQAGIAMAYNRVRTQMGVEE